MSYLHIILIEDVRAYTDAIPFQRQHVKTQARMRALGWGRLCSHGQLHVGWQDAFGARDFGRGGISLLLLADNYNLAATISTTKRTKPTKDAQRRPLNEVSGPLSCLAILVAIESNARQPIDRAASMARSRLARRARMHATVSSGAGGRLGRDREALKECYRSLK